MATSAPRWQLQLPGPQARAFQIVVALLLPSAIVATVLVHMFRGAFAPAGPGSAALVAGVLLVLALPVRYLYRTLMRHRIALHGSALEIATTFHRRVLPLADLRLTAARVVDLDERTEFRPMLKTLGTSFFGFRSGWFRLRNREPALVATAGGTRVLWLPTVRGYGLLLQPESPQALLDELRRLAGDGDRR
jgi:hypothetical protein